MTGRPRPNRDVWIRFAVAFVVSSSLLLGASFLIYRSASLHRDAMVRDDEAHAIEMRRRAVSDFLRSTMSDLALFSDLYGVGAFEASAPGWSEDLAAEAIAFLRERTAYDQVVVVDALGAEVLRVERDVRGIPVLRSLDPYPVDVPTEAQSQIARDGIAFSPFALATHDGTAESSPTPVLSVGIGLWQDGAYKGAVYVDVLASALLREFDQAHPQSGSESMLVDAAGYWMRGSDPASEWGSLSGRPVAAFATAFPNEWRRITASDNAQFETAGGLFTYSSIHPLAEMTNAAAGLPALLASASAPETGLDVWHIVSHVPISTLLATRYFGLSALLIFDLLAILLLAGVSWFVVQRTTRARQFRTRVVAENVALFSAIGRYIPKIAARLRSDSSRLARLGGESRFVAVLFADIRGFTRFSESHSPDDVVATLNRALSEITAPLLRHNGVLDKYIGDGLLAFFEPRGSRAEAAQGAVAAAREMQTAFTALQGDGAALCELGLGVGINAGPVIVGNIGSEEFMDYTVIGDAVNVAARLQAMAGPGQILVTEAVYELVRGGLPVEATAPLFLRGRREPVNVYRFLWDT